MAMSSALPPLRYSASQHRLLLGGDLVLDPWKWLWRPADAAPPDAAPITPADAVHRVFGRPGARLVPVGVIGPKAATPRQIDVAQSLGAALAARGVPVLCGGRQGVMTAVARGVAQAGGLTVGLLPEDDWEAANDFIAMPLATGIGVARNALIARAALVLIAVGGHYGTISEAAYGLHFGKPVFGLEGAPEIVGVRHMASLEALLDALWPVLLRLPGSPPAGL